MQANHKAGTLAEVNSTKSVEHFIKERNYLSESSHNFFA